MASQTLIVVGAGVAGLTLAAQAQESVNAAIYDGRVGCGGGAALALAPNAMVVLRHLGLAERVSAWGSQIKRYQFMSYRGRLRNSLPLAAVADRWGEQFWCVPRAALLTELLHAVEGTTPVYPQNVRSISVVSPDRVLVESDGGVQAEASGIVGADGIHSQVRQQLDPRTDPLVFQGYIAFRGLASVSAPDWDASSAFQIWGEGREFGFASAGPGQVYWYATMPTDTPELAETISIVDALQGLFETWMAPVWNIIQATEASEILVHPIYDRSRPMPTESGPYTLIGDAAHPMTPNLGQGACQAMVDGWQLGRLIGIEANLTEAFRELEHKRGPSVRRIVSVSRNAGRVVHLRHPWQRAVRDTVVSALPTWLLSRLVAQALGPQAAVSEPSALR